MKKLIVSAARVSLLAAVFAGVFIVGYRFTDHIFRERLIPYPAPAFGIAVGAAFVCWTYAVLSLFYKAGK